MTLKFNGNISDCKICGKKSTHYEIEHTKSFFLRTNLIWEFYCKECWLRINVIKRMEDRK